jgi:methylglutamate dehydrogenase subunit D
MSDRASALGETFIKGKFGNLANGAGVTLGENFYDFTAEIAAFSRSEEALEKMISAASAKARSGFAFQIAANRWLAAGPPDFRRALEAKFPERDGTLTDLTHGRTAFVINGSKAGWILSKLFAIDFSPGAFPENTGLATMHHDIFAQIYRSEAQAFDIFVYRSFARSFWHSLCRAAEEVGYEVV